MQLKNFGFVGLLVGGYGAYQLMRLSLSMIAPFLKTSYGFSNTEIGLIFSAFTLTYAFSRIVCGMIADRVDPRYFLVIGLIGSCVCNSIFTFSVVLGNFILFWGLNAFFQSMGAPSCARLLKYNIDKKDYGLYWAIWSFSNPLGGGIAFLFLSVVIPYFGWKNALFMMVGLAFIMGVLTLVGLQRKKLAIRGLNRKKSSENFLSHMDKPYFREILNNKLILRMCLASFCLYAIRTGFFNWFPYILKEVKGARIEISGIFSAIFELGSLFGGLMAGWMTDKFFKGNRGAVGAFYMGGMSLVILLLWFVQLQSTAIYTLIVLCFGFLAFGPQVLVGVSALDHASERTVGISTGFISLFGYMGATTNSFLLGVLSDHFGWASGFIFSFGLCLLGAYFFMRAHNKQLAK